MSAMSRRQAIAVTLAVGVGMGAVTTVAGAAEPDRVFTPEEAAKNGDADMTVRFLVRRDFSTGDEGDVLLYDYLSSDQWTGTTRYAFRVKMTDKVRRDFRRLGVTDLRAHFGGRQVTVRAKTKSVLLLGPIISESTLTIDSLSQFILIE